MLETLKQAFTGSLRGTDSPDSTKDNVGRMERLLPDGYSCKVREGMTYNGFLYTLYDSTGCKVFEDLTRRVTERSVRRMEEKVILTAQQHLWDAKKLAKERANQADLRVRLVEESRQRLNG